MEQTQGLGISLNRPGGHHVELTAKRITPRVTDGYGEVCCDAVLYNQEDEFVATYDILPLVEKVNTTYAYSISSAQRR